MAERTKTQERGRKTQERGRRARLKVLEAALAEVAERPVADIQVQRIADRAGMSPARVLLLRVHGPDPGGDVPLERAAPGRAAGE